MVQTYGSIGSMSRLNCRIEPNSKQHPTIYSKEPQKRRNDSTIEQQHYNARQPDQFEGQSIRGKSAPPLLTTTYCYPNLEQSEEGQSFGQRKTSSATKYFKSNYRYVLALYVFMGLTLSHYSRLSLPLAVIDMVAGNVRARESSRFVDSANNFQASNGEDILRNSCPVISPTPFGSSFTQLPMNVTLANNISQQKSVHNVSTMTQLEEQINEAIAQGQLVEWTPTEQGWIFAASNIGAIILGTPMSRLGEIYGPKWVIFGSNLACALHGLLLPLVVMTTDLSVWFMMVFEIVLCGLGFSIELVAYTLFTDWLSPVELAFSIGTLQSVFHFGAMLSTLVNGQILAHPELGWQWCFYTPGILCTFWGLGWLVVGSNRMHSSRFVSDEELLHVMAKNKAIPERHKQQEEPDAKNMSDSNNISRSNKAPWAKIFKDPTVWALVLNKFVLKWNITVTLNLFPTYLNNILHSPVAVTSLVCGSSSLVGLISCFLISYLCKSLVIKRPFNLPLTAMRKISQTILNGSSVILFLMLALWDCNLNVALAVYIFIAITINFVVGGSYQVPLDLSKDYCALIFSIANSLAIGQVIGTPISGAIINSNPDDRYTWRLVWYIVAAMHFVAGIIFIKFVDCSPRNYTNNVKGDGNEDGKNQGSSNQNYDGPSSSGCSSDISF